MSFIMSEALENSKIQNEANAVCGEIANRLMQSGLRTGNNISLAAYLLYKAGQSGECLDFEAALTSVEKENVKCLLKERFGEGAWSKLRAIGERYSLESIAAAALLPVRSYDAKDTATPSSVVKLVQALLDVNDGERVADVCCGVGSYVISEALEKKNATYFGYEINAESAAIAEIRSELVDAKVQIHLCDAFDLGNLSGNEKFDKIFSNYPFGSKLRYLGAGNEFVDLVSEQCPGLTKATSSDWVFNALLCNLMAKNGKAIGIMTNGSTWNSIDAPARKYFVEQDLIESVIALPGRMFPYTAIGTTLIIFSHGNEDIRMVDATALCQQGRRQNEFTAKNIEAILRALHEDSEYSKVISKKELRENEYNLNLSRYIKKEVPISNGVPFESVVTNISRGAPCTAAQLDEIVSDKPTNMQYLMLANIQDGIIDNKLPYLSQIEPKFEKYCLKNNSLILSKNGAPFKIAVASVKEGQRILANGNLYIIELDERRVDPYYLKAYFDSEQGALALKSIAVGATIPNIAVDQLKKLMIPLPPMEQQLRIAQRYQAALDEIAMLKLRLQKATDRLHHVFDEEGE